MGATLGDIILLSLEILGLSVYIIFMYTVHKYRDRVPFNTPFFKIIFALGIIDIGKQLEEVLLFKFPRFAWFGLNKMVTSLPFFFGKVHAMFVWYFGHAQVIGVLLVAINRVSVCGFVRDWTRFQLHMTLVILWGFPLLFNVPLWPNEFYFSDNGTADGAAFIYWKNTELRWYYLVTCGMLCSGIAIICGLCYLVIVVKVCQMNKQVAKSKVKKRDDRKTHEEKKLICIGVVLAICVAFCGFACTMYAYAVDPMTMEAILPILYLNDALLCWINPYILLVSSPIVRKYFKAVVLCRPPNDIQPTV